MTTQPNTTIDSPQALGTIEYLDPETLELEDNVRDDVDLDKDFLASLREHGVLVPITAVRTEDGRTMVREGQCRTLGARSVGLKTIPVFVRSAADGQDAKTATQQRIAEQMVANDKREGLTAGQRARGIQRMLDTGMTPAKVAKQLSDSASAVKAAGIAAKSSIAMEALDGGQMNFEEAAALVEFDADEEAVRRLMLDAGTGHFKHTVTRLRERREYEKRRAVAAAEYVAKGYTVLDSYPGWQSEEYVSMRHLRTDTDEIPTAAVIRDPAHWAAYLTEDEAYFDKETGEQVDEDLIDGDTEEDPTLEPDEGLRHFNSVELRRVFEAEWYCRDHVAAGLKLAPSTLGRGRAERKDNSPEAEAQRQEAERRERRKVRVLNLLGDAAAVVRREYVTKLLASKTPPKGTATFTAYCMTRDHYILNQNNGDSTAAELLGVKSGRDVRDLVADPAKNVDARAQVVTLALVLGALEARCTKDAWRSARAGITGGAIHNTNTIGSDTYLQFLVDTGYTPAEVEKVILGQRTADDLFDAESAEQ